MAKVMPEGILDLQIIGAGPAGLTAGMYASRARMNVVLLESYSVMGQMTMTDMVENFPGAQQASGFELMSKFRQQSLSFGLKIESGTVSSIEKVNVDGVDAWKTLSDGKERISLAVVVATGARPRALDVPGEKELLGKGVSYCATCDGPFFKDKDIVVVGGGDTAVEEALFLTKFGRTVSLVHRRDRLRATPIVQERALENDKMRFIWDSVVEQVLGTEKVSGVSLKNVKTGETKALDCDAVFVFVGWAPNTGFLGGTVEMSRASSILVGVDMSSSAEGIFAAGDCTEKPLHQIVTACADGATAAVSAQHFVDTVKGTAYV